MQNIYQAKGLSLEDQYRDVGRLFAANIQKSVHKIGRKRSRLINIRRNVAEKTWAHLQSKEQAKDFCTCLIAWSEGAGVTPAQAMWCLADNLSGCQTFMVRYDSGVALLHSEEEFRDNPNMELHMTKPHTMEFRDGDTAIKTLVYNDLMPGAGLYGWKSDMIVAVDSLFLREDGIEAVESPLLANVVSWMIWHMSPTQAEPDLIVKMLSGIGELVDGYAINVVRKVGVKVLGYKLTLARTGYHIEYLGETLGSYIRQVNIIDPEYPKMEWELPPKNIWRGGYKYFRRRLSTMDSHASTYRGLAMRSLDKETCRAAHTTIQSTLYGELASSYVNIDMGAICVGLVDLQVGTSVSCKLNDGSVVSIIEYLDVI